MVCLPGITITAIFTAVILLDLYHRDWRRVPGHALFGVFATLLVLFLCERTSELVAWTLIAAPILFAILGWIMHMIIEALYAPPSPSTRKNTDVGCPCCTSIPCSCRSPCRHRPRPRPEPSPDVPICPGPIPPPRPTPEPAPACPKPGETCIKPSLA